jgi:hypothetical protein
MHKTILVGKPERKGSLAKPRRRWKDNIKMGLKEVGCRLHSSGPVRSSGQFAQTGNVHKGKVVPVVN